jgi:hypothetical protein
MEMAGALAPPREDLDAANLLPRQPKQRMNFTTKVSNNTKFRSQKVLINFKFVVAFVRLAVDGIISPPRHSKKSVHEPKLQTYRGRG